MSLEFTTKYIGHTKKMTTEFKAHVYYDFLLLEDYFDEKQEAKFVKKHGLTNKEIGQIARDGQNGKLEDVTGVLSISCVVNI